MNNFNAENWAKLVSGATCSLCHETENIVVGQLKSGRVEFVPDANFIGYCILIHKRHVIELYDLTESERADFITDISIVAECLNEQLQPTKINYEVLGNATPHLHCHIFPRYINDGYWGGPIWWRPIEKRTWLTDEEATKVAKKIRAALAKK